MNTIKRLSARLKKLILTKRAYKFVISDWTALGDLKNCSAVAGSMRFSRNLEPLEMDRPEADRLLVIAPHPDDEIMGPGGTLLKCLKAGSRIHVVYLTSGKPELSGVMEREAGEVSRAAGYGTTFLGYPLGDIPLNEGSIRAIGEEITRFSPGAIFVPFLFDDHDDHRRANQLLMETCRRMNMDEGPEVWAYQVYTALIPNVIVDITEQSKEKGALIRMWDSQMKIRDWAHYALGLNAFNSRFLKKDALPRFVEGFFVVPLKEYLRLCGIYFGRRPGENYYFKSYRNEADGPFPSAQ